MKKIEFKNLPDKTTPINSTNLNKIQDNIEEVFEGKESMGSIVVDDITCKNILPNNIQSQTINGVTVTKNNDGSITLNGTATDNITLVIYESASGIILNGDYRFYVIGKNTKVNLQGTVGGNNVAFMKYSDTKESVPINYSTDTQLTKVYTYITSGYSYNNVTLKYMITKGTNEESYVPHKEYDNADLKGKYLWINPNPTEAIAYQYGGITLTSSDYDVLEFYFYTSTDNKAMTVQKTMAGYGVCGMYIDGFNGLMFGRDIFYVSKTVYTIHECYRYGYGVTKPPAGTNNYLIPAYVIGYKNSIETNPTTSTASVDETE